MKQNFNFAIKELLKSEGGYSNHPDDKGGPTNFGITITDYRLYIKRSGTSEDVRNMTQQQAIDIYKSKYWDALDCDNLPSGLDYCVFDYGVNSGVARAKKVLLSFENIKDTKKLINLICDERLSFMKRIRGGKDWSVFGKGWSSRVARVRNDSLSLASNNTPVIVGSAAAAGIAVTSYHWPNEIAPWVALGVISVFVLGFFSYMLYRYYKEV